MATFRDVPKTDVALGSPAPRSEVVLGWGAGARKRGTADLGQQGLPVSAAKLVKASKQNVLADSPSRSRPPEESRQRQEELPSAKFGLGIPGQGGPA